MGATAAWFRFGVDHGLYHPRPVRRQPNTVLFYARPATPRRAVPMGMLALGELWRRRPDVRIVLFGTDDEIDASFPYELLGLVSPETLAQRYREAAVGVCLSLTNYSLIPQEMMACGLPCVDLSGRSPEAVFGRDGPVELAEPDPLSIADAVEALLTDADRWRRRSEAGLAFVADATWERAARQVEAGLRAALSERLTESASARASSSGTPRRAATLRTQKSHGPTHPGRNRLARSNTSGSSESIEWRSRLRKTKRDVGFERATLHPRRAGERGAGGVAVQRDLLRPNVAHTDGDLLPFVDLADRGVLVGGIGIAAKKPAATELPPRVRSMHADGERLPKATGVARPQTHTAELLWNCYRGLADRGPGTQLGCRNGRHYADREGQLAPVSSSD